MRIGLFGPCLSEAATDTGVRWRGGVRPCKSDAAEGCFARASDVEQTVRLTPPFSPAGDAMDGVIVDAVIAFPGWRVGFSVTKWLWRLAGEKVVSFGVVY